MEPEITPEQAMEAVKAAGLDPDRTVSEQVAAPGQVDERTVKGWVSEAVAEAQPASAEEQALRFAEQFRDKLDAAQSRWFSVGGNDAR